MKMVCFCEKVHFRFLYGTLFTIRRPTTVIGYYFYFSVNILENPQSVHYFSVPA